MDKNRISEQCLLSFICFVSIYLSNFGICFNVDTIDPKTWKDGRAHTHTLYREINWNLLDKKRSNKVENEDNFLLSIGCLGIDEKSPKVKNIAQVRELMGNNTIWFGVSMSTDYATKNALIVCAHLYTYMLIDRQMIEGFCQLVNDGQKGQSFGNCAGCQGSLNCQICQTGSSLYFKDLILFETQIAGGRAKTF
ncbi:hypothetical protein HELRODRAFT_158964 [Helobdella robusta]|uniref:Uncharacterized protein n=1 Tax=Helobdella robusta TaxID=6412 RepID=T1ENG0_HELRO|nr:hypothetical protein HELRODRAFT_158964 [Helobdella robusta]ESO12432.1 hypothetical protein HELRODRAFT_158964 [Helobdella robusta]